MVSISLTATAVLLVSLAEVNGELLNGYVHHHDLATIRQRLYDGDAITTVAFNELIRKADASLTLEPQAMPVFNVPAFYGEQQAEHSRMKNLLSNDSAAAFYLALAAALTDDQQDKQRYADRAAGILDDWASTNGDVVGADGNLVMCYNGTAFVFAADALELTDCWEHLPKVRFKRWICQILLPAARIKQRQNNWACWGIMASLTAHRFLRDETGFDSDVTRLRDIIDEQIEPDGSMPHEIKRGTRSLWYTYFALAPLTVAIDMTRDNGHEDLFDYSPPSEGTVEQAVTFFFECGIEDQSRWPVDIDEAVDRKGKYATLMFAMGNVYDNDEWKSFAIHPLWRDRGGLAWICPSLLRLNSRRQRSELQDISPQNPNTNNASAE